MQVGESRMTTDHAAITAWVEERGGRPATVVSTFEDGDDIGILRIDFPGYGDSDDELEFITWDEFFEKFEENDLAFLFQEKTADGEESRYYKFVKN